MSSYAYRESLFKKASAELEAEIAERRITKLARLAFESTVHNHNLSHQSSVLEGTDREVEKNRKKGRKASKSDDTVDQAISISPRGGVLERVFPDPPNDPRIYGNAERVVVKQRKKEGNASRYDDNLDTKKKKEEKHDTTQYKLTSYKAQENAVHDDTRGKPQYCMALEQPHTASSESRSRNKHETKANSEGSDDQPERKKRGPIFIPKPSRKFSGFRKPVSSVRKDQSRDPHALSKKALEALEEARRSSYGNFVVQNSNFGNFLMPCIPTWDENSLQIWPPSATKTMLQPEGIVQSKTESAGLKISEA